MKQVVVQFDVDGVLADWTRGFTELANGLWGPGTCPELQETTAPQYTNSNQFTPKHCYHDTWEALLRTPNWWASLKPMVFGSEFGRIARLCLEVPVYFVTNRWHYMNPANWQTTCWLRQYGVPNASVICTRDKGEAAYLLHTTFSIEDKLENAKDIWDNMLPTSKSYLINRLHNQQPYCPDLRVDTVAQFLDQVEKEI